MTDIFEHQEDEVNKISFVHPEYLPNTSFIKTKPKSIHTIFFNIVEKYREECTISKYQFCKDFLNTRRSYDEIMSIDYDMNIRTMQEIINKIDHSKKTILDSDGKKLYRIKRVDLRKNILKKIDLFNKRHYMKEGNASKFHFGSKKAIALFRLGKITFRRSTVDKVLLTMYECDKEQIKIMGKTYIDWERRNRNSAPE